VIGRDGEPILGMEKFAKQSTTLRQLIQAGKTEWILSPNAKPDGDLGASSSNAHGAFDDDKATVLSTLARILGRKSAGEAKSTLSFHSGQGRLRGTRENLNALDGPRLSRV
jgi:hypothetical protein